MKPLNANRTILTVLLLTLIFASSAYAKKGDGKCPFMEEKKDKSEKSACVTDEQKDQLTALRQQFIDETAEIRMSLNTAHKNLNILLETSEPDKKEIKSLIKEITELGAALLEKKIDHQLEVKKIAPDQAGRKMFQRCMKMGKNDGFKRMCSGGSGKATFSSGWGCCGR